MVKQYLISNTNFILLPHGYRVIDIINMEAFKSSFVKFYFSRYFTGCNQPHAVNTGYLRKPGIIGITVNKLRFTVGIFIGLYKVIVSIICTQPSPSRWSKRFVRAAPYAKQP